MCRRLVAPRLLALLLAVVPLQAARAQIVDATNYAGCYNDAFVSTCFSIPYTLTSVVPTVNAINGGPILFGSLSLASNTQFIAIYQVFAFPGYVTSPEDGHIGGSTFETSFTHQSTLPPNIGIRFAEVVNCPNTGIYSIPICGAFGDPAITLIQNQYVSDILVPLTAVPEPSTLTLVALGLATLTGVTVAARRRGRVDVYGAGFTSLDRTDETARLSRC